MIYVWKPIESAPMDGSEVYCRWPGFDGAVHEGNCVWKCEWYALGKPVKLTVWWTGPEFKNPTAKDPTHWRAAAPNCRMEIGDARLLRAANA